MKKHIPVLLKDTVDYLVKSGTGKYFDATLGFGGHTAEILSRLDSRSVLVGTDKDDDAIKHCRESFKDESRLKIYKAAFTNIDKIAKIEFIESFDGIIADLGVSSYQFDNLESGFTYREDAPLDLRMDKSTGTPASELINNLTKEELRDIFYKYGEERKSGLIASVIVRERETAAIETTASLRRIIESVIPQPHTVSSLSRIFQALRIYVNGELDELREFLEKSVSLLSKGGRIAVISYHSLEDRIVKELFKYESLDCICPRDFPVCVCKKEKRLELITRKAVIPSDDEIKDNRRSRSAKLRVAERI